MCMGREAGASCEWAERQGHRVNEQSGRGIMRMGRAAGASCAWAERQGHEWSVGGGRGGSSKGGDMSGQEAITTHGQSGGHHNPWACRRPSQP